MHQNRYVTVNDVKCSREVKFLGIAGRKHSMSTTRGRQVQSFGFSFVFRSYSAIP